MIKFPEPLLSILFFRFVSSLFHPFWVKGLKFGIYTDRGYWTCAGRPGSAEFEEVDAKTFVQWEVDYVKTDALLGKCWGKDGKVTGGVMFHHTKIKMTLIRGSMVGMGGFNDETRDFKNMNGAGDRKGNSSLNERITTKIR